MDKKAVQILNRLMDDRKKHSVSAEELAYARKMGVVVEDRPITLDQALDVLERCFEAVSQEDAAQAFLYSLSSRDTGNLWQSLSHPLNWWHGANRV